MEPRSPSVVSCCTTTRTQWSIYSDQEQNDVDTEPASALQVQRREDTLQWSTITRWITLHAPSSFFVWDDSGSGADRNNSDYIIDNRDLLGQDPETLSRTTLINDRSISQQVTRDVEYSYEQSLSWSTTFGLEIGVSVSVSAGVPEVSSTAVRNSTFVTMS